MSSDPTAPAAHRGRTSPLFNALVTPEQSADAWLQAGYDRLYDGRPKEALTAFRTACAVTPTLADAWAAMADATEASEGPTGAVAGAYDRAVALDPGRWSWSVSRAGALLKAGRVADAAAAFGGLVEQRLDSATARLGFARALAAADRKDEALESYREAVALRPDDRDAVLELAALLLETGDAVTAVEVMQPLSRRDPDDAELHHRIGRAWMVLREPGKALAALRRALALDEEDRLGNAPVIAALEAAGEAADLTPAYVRALFDRYADRFDQDLVGKLGYSAPELLRAAVDRAGGGTGLRVLDLGCGTGLAGLAFRPMAARLVGVDLSPRMVEKARARALYDDVWVEDVVDAAQADRGVWELMVAADVLVYLGDLRPLFVAVALGLVTGGRFAATAERSDGEADHTLGATRRYTHSEGYVRRMAAETGFRVLLLEPCITRRERGVGVPGLLFVMEKGPAA